MSQILISVVLAALTALCIYTANISKTQNMQGDWLFYAFSLFFAIPLVVIIIKALGQKNSGFKKIYDKLARPQEERTRFTPHWFMALFVVIFVVIAVVNIIKIVFEFAKSY